MGLSSDPNFEFPLTLSDPKYKFPGTESLDPDTLFTQLVLPEQIIVINFYRNLILNLDPFLQFHLSTKWC